MKKTNNQLNKNLTLCLFILDRNEFTLRFLRYYNKSKLNYPLVIGDGSKYRLKSDIKNEIKKNSSIKYFKFSNEYDKKKREYNQNKFYQRILFCLKKVKTKYVKFISDDDFIIKYSTEKCINFLEKNKSFDGVGGSILDYSINEKYYGKINYMKTIYKIKNFKSKNIERKLTELYLNWFHSWYLIFRTKKILKIFKISSRYNNFDKDYKDQFHETVIHIFLNIKFFNDPIIFHESHNDPHIGATRGNILERLTNKDFLKNLDIFTKSINKVWNFKNKTFVRDLHFQNILANELKSYNNKSYYSMRDIYHLIKINVKTKFKKNNFKVFFKNIKNIKLKKEIEEYQNFLLKK